MRKLDRLRQTRLGGIFSTLQQVLWQLLERVALRGP